jgi:hypothetical protein
VLLLLRECHLTEPHIAKCGNGDLLPITEIDAKTASVYLKSGGRVGNLTRPHFLNERRAFEAPG